MKTITDKKDALRVVSEDGYKLKFASEALRDDRDIVLAAVTQKGVL